jgi:hypothetical protein
MLPCRISASSQYSIRTRFGNASLDHEEAVVFQDSTFTEPGDTGRIVRRQALSASGLAERGLRLA